MDRLRIRLGVAAAVACGLLLCGGVALAWSVNSVVHPTRRVESVGALNDAVLAIEDVRIEASDGISLAGFVLAGEPGRPWVVLCHDLGSNKGELLPLGLTIQESGFSVLLFDLRGHGGSDGGASGLGVAEKADVLGAIDFARARAEGLPIGLFGAGIGAHAAVLAAIERTDVRVLVLDGLYPDGTYPLLEGVFGGWEFGARTFGFLARAMYEAMTRDEVGRQQASEVLPRLVGRHVLLLAPAADPRLADRMEAMVGTIPVTNDADGNLVMLPVTGSGRLYGEDSVRYRDEVAGFLRSRLPPS